MKDAFRPNLFREVNERIAEVTGVWHWEDPQGYLCECTDDGCTEAVWLTRAQYESIRAARSRFVTAPGHERGAARVVERHSDFVVVEARGDAETSKLPTARLARTPAAVGARAAHRPRL